MLECSEGVEQSPPLLELVSLAFDFVKKRCQP
jgi:hypothetical protein